MDLTFRLARAPRQILRAATAMPFLALAPIASRAAAPIVVKSEAIELPAEAEAFPPGPGLDVVSANCTACHSPGMVLNQPPLSKAVWETEVRKMIKVFKASVQEKDIDAIVGYLVAVKGPN